MRSAYVLSIILAVSVLGSEVHAADKLDPKPLEAIIDNALKGYNDGDYKVFFADYAKSMAAVATEQTFKSMYTDQYKKNLGDYVSRKPIDKETVLMGDFPLMVFDAEFSKEKKVKLSVNFTKEDGKFKIMQMRFDKQ